MTPTRKINVMRKQFINSVILLAIAGWVFGACTSQPLPGSDPAEEPVIVEPETVDGMVLSATLSDGEATKTTLNDLGDHKYETLWKTGDQISINGTKSEAVAAADNGKKAVDFTFNGSLSAPYNVLYPGTTSANAIALPATQNYVAGSFDGAAAASYGKATLGANNKWSVKFHSFCGILRFSLNGSATLSRIEVKSYGSENLYGSFTVSDFETGAFSGGTSGTLTYNIGSVTLSGSDTDFYIAIPAQRYASGIEVIVYQSDGAFMRLIPNWKSGYTLAQDTVVEFGSKTFAAGRTEDVFSINALAAEDGGEPTSAKPGITVATFNVLRFDDENRPSAAVTATSIEGSRDRPANAIIRSCSEMQVALGNAIKNTEADLIGFQEIGKDMYSTSGSYSLENIARSAGVTNLTWKLGFTTTSSSSSSDKYKYSNGFAYNSSVLKLEDSGRVWLRENSTSYSTSSSDGAGDPNRTVVWAKFTHRISGKIFFFFVTQLPTITQNGGANMAGGLGNFASAKAGSSPKIVAGDMNAAPFTDKAGTQVNPTYTTLTSYWTDAYEAIDAAGNLNSLYKIYPGTQSGTGGTYQYDILRYCKNHPERRLDHIMTNGACTAQSYKTIRTTYELSGYDYLLAPSDHLPVVAYITLD